MFFRHFTDFPLAVVLINEKTEMKKKIWKDQILFNKVKSNLILKL